MIGDTDSSEEESLLIPVGYSDFEAFSVLTRYIETLKNIKGAQYYSDLNFLEYIEERYSDFSCIFL